MYYNQIRKFLSSRAKALRSEGSCISMMNCIAILFVLFLADNSVNAQSFTPVKDAAALQKNILEASKKISTIQCDMTQEKAMAMLTEKAVSKGKFYFKKSDKVRLEYQQPAKNLIVMNGEKMMMQDDKKTSKMDMHRSKMFQQLSNIIVGSISGSLFNGKDFTVSFAESKAQVEVILKPINKIMRNYLSNIVMVMDKKDYTAVSIKMNEPSGDNTLISFSNKQLNVALGDELFVVK